MELPEFLVAGAVLVVVFTSLALLSSRTLTEYLVRQGLLPRSFLQLSPLFASAVRWIAIILLILGLGRAAVVAGLLSGDWIRRYGLAALMVLAGVGLLWLSYHRRSES